MLLLHMCMANLVLKFLVFVQYSNFHSVIWNERVCIAYIVIVLIFYTFHTEESAVKH